MPQMVQVVGGLTRNGIPAQGWITFTPSRLWVYENQIPWACLAPTIHLDPDGQFAVLLTPTDTDTVPWHYKVTMPGASWIIAPVGTRMRHLKELVDEHRAWPCA